MSDALAALVRHLTLDVNLADPGRVFLAGVSMGGHGCYELAAQQPGLFSALVPVAAHLEGPAVQEVARVLRSWGLPTWAFHGVGDCCCCYEDAVELVRSLGGSAGLTTYWGGRDGQSVHSSASAVAFVEHGSQLLAWLLKQPRTCPSGRSSATTPAQASQVYARRTREWHEESWQRQGW
ncbi:unnamed protein product [Polarella glacialis]|nr:unnamed protein product [Polarella glacialis]